ncbi:MAG: TIM barrel protein [Clostridiales bacterium]|nr:TIM barrel protein [Clostridiales bacterium]
MDNFKIGLTSTTFRQKSHSEIVGIAKDAGAQYIEWGTDIHVKTPDDAANVKSLCDAAGIGICSCGSYYTAGCGDKDEWLRICALAHEMSAPSIRIWLGNKNSEKTSAAEYERLLEDTRSMCSAAERSGLTVCAECHGNTFNNNTDAILRFCDELKCENFRTYFQSRYHSLDYDLDRIERTFEITRDVHISYSELTREQRFKKKNREYIDILLKKLLEKDFAGVVMIEFTRQASAEYFMQDVKRLKSY